MPPLFVYAYILYYSKNPTQTRFELMWETPMGTLIPLIQKWIFFSNFPLKNMKIESEKFQIPIGEYEKYVNTKIYEEKK